jgi:outer membrane receptor protein involved in Fe transport
VLFQFYLLFFLISTSHLANADTAETVVVSPKTEFTGEASFETLNQDTFIPTDRTSLSGDHATTVDTIKWNNPYPLVDYGYPGGASGVNVGGRSIEDTQVTTLGVPLNLPQGGGADFSIFPSFLWDQVTISEVTSSAGFAPSAASGHVDFSPWTREQIMDQKNDDPKDASVHARATLSYDHDSQTYSLGAATSNYSALVGAITGEISGVAGETSALVFKNGSGHILAHIIGSEERVYSPGSLRFPTPGAYLKTWRLIPVVESSYKLSDGLQIQTTAYADLSQLIDQDPNLENDSDTRTNQFGVENVLVNGSNTLAISARYVEFLGASYGALHEVPLFVAYTRDVSFSESTSLKASVNGTELASTGFYPGARASFKFASSEKSYPFAELNTIAKMPTLVDRYANYGGYFFGNPNLKPERVFAALGGYRFQSGRLQNTTTFKSEYRTGIQVANPDETSVVNGGDAYLFSLNESASDSILSWLDARGTALFTYSKLKDSGFSYPDLPYATATSGLRAHFQESYSLEADARLVGVSAGPNGRNHPDYALFDLVASYQPTKNIRIDAGLDNIFSADAQAVLDYPLEGRRFFASLNASL